ncbi:MAG: TatD family hydrolase [Tepidanaerobacteraceae bacterium]|nr:Qat anti-phage system TatD family nuclease QatD [Heliomicrobium modesticaldum]MCR4431595.1 TatD family hydrolase [Tepidanaerobacteraceae bacterium]
MRYIDSHCHLDLFDNMNKFLDDTKNYKNSIITMTTTPRAYQKNRELCSRYSHVFVALGLHPQLIAEREKELDILFKYIEEAKFIGEIGIDQGPRYYKTIDAQIRIFNDIIDKCDWYGNKIISIHSLRSADIILEILRSNVRNKSNKFIMHWFTGDIKTLQDAIKLGCFFSINSQMINSDRGKKIVSILPKEKILVESDAPFVIKFESGKEHNQYMNETVRLINEIRKEDISQQISLNGIELLSQ